MGPGVARRRRVRVDRRRRGRAPGRSSSPTLSEVRPGATCRVVALTIDNPVRRRLLELGLVPGAVVEVIRHAPLYDPLEVRVGATRVAVRRTEAAAIKVADLEVADVFALE